jgi:hypothetical protein
MLLGLSGRLGVGKDYIAQKILQPFIESQFPKERCIQLAFADQLKINTIINHNIPFESVFIKKTKETRKLLQKEGTDVCRATLGQDIWIRYVDNWIKTWKTRGFTTFILTDVRFKNEIDWIHNRGGIVIRIEAPIRSQQKSLEENMEFKSKDRHQSEIDLDNQSLDTYDLVYNNDPGNGKDHPSKLYEFIESQLNTKKF